MEKKYCLECEEVLRGRTDKKFCGDSCRSAFHNRMKNAKNPMMRLIDSRLKKNRQILDYFLNNVADDNGRVSLTAIRRVGFAFDYFTHKEDDSSVYYCYDLGYYIDPEERIIQIKQTALDKGVDLFL
jgi:hypothetical protein